MTRDDDFIGQLEAYLEEHEGMTALPETVRNAVRAHLPKTRQLGRFGVPMRRSPIMRSNRFGVGIAAAGVLVAVLIGASLLPKPSVGPSPTPTAVTEPAASLVPWLLGYDPIDPGRYHVKSGVFSYVTIEVPSGWSAHSVYGVTGPHGGDAPNGMGVYLTTVRYLAQDSQAADGGGTLDVGPSVDELTQAILTHPGWKTTGPTDIAIHGYHGKLVELKLPADFVRTGFHGYSISLGDTPEIVGWVPKQTFDFYIVDAGGPRMVVVAFHFAGTPLEDLAAQRTVLESIRFESNP